MILGMHFNINHLFLGTAGAAAATTGACAAAATGSTAASTGGASTGTSQLSLKYFSIIFVISG